MTASTSLNGTARIPLAEMDTDALIVRADVLSEWGEPDWAILNDRRGNLPDFPSDALIQPLREYVDRASFGAGVTFAHVAVPLLSIASGVIGTARRIQASRSWIEPLSIWSALVGLSSMLREASAAVANLRQSPLRPSLSHFL
jgi:hypothetical protein